MTGIYLLFIIVMWTIIVTCLARILTRKIPLATWRMPLALLIFAALLPLPLIDELVGGWQFDYLCKQSSTIQLNRVTAIGKTVYLDPQPSVEIKGTWVRIVLQPHQFVDATTRNLIASYNTLISGGGRFIQILGISEGGMPLTFRGSCGPSESVKKLFNSLDITAVDRPAKITK